jgi:spore germination cell wall hydrolase CwlJ-like protein
MTSLACLALIIYHEARSMPLQAQHLVAQVAITRAYNEKQSVCKSLNVKKGYSFMWDKRSNSMKEVKAKTIAYQVAKKSLHKHANHSYTYFNECTLGKRFKTKTRMVRIKKLCFY